MAHFLCSPFDIFLSFPSFSSPAWLHQQLVLCVFLGAQAEPPQETAHPGQWQADHEQKPVCAIQGQRWYLWLFQPGFLGGFYLGLFVSRFALFKCVEGTLDFNQIELLAPSPVSPTTPASLPFVNVLDLSASRLAPCSRHPPVRLTSLPHVPEASRPLRFVIELYDTSSDNWKCVVCYHPDLFSNINQIITNMYCILIISGTILGTLRTLFYVILKMNLWSRYCCYHPHFMNEETEA